MENVRLNNYFYSSIEVNNNCLYPIEHLFKAIYIMENISELDKEVERLSKKLKTFLFKATKETEGKRIYMNTISYYPTGLCEWGNRTIILPEWKSNYEPPEPEQKADIADTVEKIPVKKRTYSKPRRYPSETGLRDNYMLYYAQLREYDKKKYSTANDQFNINEILKKKEIYDKLDESAKEMVNKNHNFSNQIHSGSNKITRFLVGHINTGIPGNLEALKKTNLRIPLLMEDELEDLRTACDLAKKDHDNHQSFHKPLLSEFIIKRVKEFINNLDMEREDRVVINLNEALTLHREEKKRRYYRGEEETYIHEYTTTENVPAALAKQLAEIKDESILKIFDQFGLLAMNQEEKEPIEA